MARLRSPPDARYSEPLTLRKSATIRQLFRMKSRSLSTSSRTKTSVPYTAQGKTLQPGFHRVGVLPSERPTVEDETSYEDVMTQINEPIRPRDLQDLAGEEPRESVKLDQVQRQEDGTGKSATIEEKSESYNEDFACNTAKTAARLSIDANATVAEADLSSLSPLTISTTTSEPIVGHMFFHTQKGLMKYSERSIGPFKVHIPVTAPPFLEDLTIPYVIALSVSAFVGPRALLLAVWKLMVLLMLYDKARQYWDWGEDRSLDIVLAPVEKGREQGRKILIQTLSFMFEAVLDAKAEVTRSRA
ncbi:hypothetical protein DM02DRAFT_628201 [Periconia macrospinosa]|uniref:Uncharacterized protein n=1 Tax=Periconia macrospinosa TaxID=97972 RepID=A0A2V1DRX5_9PLEO|nr:hypothetical protein DM02DRAFT_628201 [Periconia macrospinosa]